MSIRSRQTCNLIVTSRLNCQYSFLVFALYVSCVAINGKNYTLEVGLIGRFLVCACFCIILI